MKSTVFVTLVLVSLTASSLAAHIDGLNKKTDFKTMSPDQVQTLLLNASSIEVHVPKNLISDHTTMELCNGKKYGWTSPDEMGEQPCVIVATVGSQDLNNAEILLRNMQALFRACGLYASSETETYGDDRSGYSCGLLGSLFYAIGNAPAARAAWDAPGCQSHDVNGHPLDGCMIFIIGKWSSPLQLGGPVEWVDAFNSSRVDAYSSDRAKLISMATEACKRDMDFGSCNFLQTETGKQADWAAIENARRERHSDFRDHFVAEDAQREQESRDKDARFNSVMSALQSMPGANDPNAITNAANQQAVAIRATADANAARTQPVYQAPVYSSPAQSTVVSPPAVSNVNSQNSPAAVNNTASTASIANAPVHIPNQDNCITTQVKQFYPGQSGSETLYLTNNCNYSVNVDLAVNEGGIAFLVQLNAGMTSPSGDMGEMLSKNYQYWYCPMPEFPSDPNNNPQDGPKYGATGVICRK